MSTMADTAAQAVRNNVVYPLPRPTDGTAAWRLEIDEFITDTAVANLFLIALSEMQTETLTSGTTPTWWSFYSLAGIHSMPRESWGNVGSQRGAGYCHHGMSTFPTWHRAYMFQMEQAVYTKMIDVANRYSGNYKTTYLAAANRFRLPYWDITMPRNKTADNASDKARRTNSWFWGLPKILTTPQVYVRYPDSPDQLKPASNPLYQFTFPTAKAYQGTNRPAIDFERGTLQGWQIRFNRNTGRDERVPGSFNEQSPNLLHTARGPTARTKGDSDYQYLEEAVQLQAREATTYFWQLLTPVDARGRVNTTNQDRSWDYFASHAQVSRDETWEEMQSRSIESWHDNIHGLIGTGQGFSGQMGNPAIAAFDPIFWLHHNNIERILCLYQSLYPEKYVTRGRRQDQPQNVQASTPNIWADDQLFPFRKENGSNKCFTSWDLRDWTRDGYATPGDKADSGVSDKVAQYLRDTYYWATNPGTVPDFDKLQYPKDFTSNEALTGKPLPSSARPRLSFKAIATGAQPALVARSVNLESVVETKQLQQQSIKADDKVIDPAEFQAKATEIEQAAPAGAMIDADKSDVDTKMNTWNVHFRVKKYAYNGSFNIHFFIGDVEEATPEKYMTRMNEAGYSSIFASSAETECAQCDVNREAGLVYEDVVPLSNILQDYLVANPISEGLITTGEHRTIRDMSVEEVVPFLKQNLRWRLTNTAGQDLPYLAQSELKVVVAGRLFVPPQGDNLLGTYGRSRVYGQATAGKDGGYDGDDFDML